MLFRLAALSALLGASVAMEENTPYDTYEVWGCDQSNSVEGKDALGVAGSYLWIWDESDVDTNVMSGTTPSPKSCLPGADTGPCDMIKMFPPTLTDSASNEPLAEQPGFGRWHGITKDPQNMYVTANVFVPGGGYIGIVDAETKGAVALFRVTEMKYAAPTEDDASNTKTTRSVHMSFWNHDGSAIIVHNLAGKAVERINIVRDSSGKIASATFDKSATVGMGRSMAVTTEASFFEGNNAFGAPLIGGVSGSYDDADLGDLTPTGHCKEDGCGGAAGDFGSPGRPNNVGICPVISPNGLVFNTLGGGGLLVMDSTKTPMSIVGAYGNGAVYGAGVCGETVGERTYFTSGVSASGAGAAQSMWALYAFRHDDFDDDGYTSENAPAPDFFFDFPGTATGGRTEGFPPVSPSADANNSTGDDAMTEADRRDAHDLAGTVDGRYLHVVDRIQNVLDVFDAETNEHVSTVHLATATGEDDGTVGPCGAASVADGGPDFPANDLAADFIAPTPDGRYMMLGLRGPAPVSAAHAAQGSCPGVGIVELTGGGKSGKLAGVLRATNTLPDGIDLVTPSAGSPYSGEERSDVHDVVVVFKKSATATTATTTTTAKPPAGETTTSTTAAGGGTTDATEPAEAKESSAGFRTKFAALASAVGIAAVAALV